MKRIFKFLKYLILIFIGIIVTLTVVYFLGPKPPPPQFLMPTLQASSSLSELEKTIYDSEKAVPHIKQGCEAHIVWADSLRKEKTPIALLYLHGFGASHKEGYPVDENLAKKFGCNLYLARLAEHGKEEGEYNMLKFNADEYYQSAEKALHVAMQLGDSVVIVGTSGGGAMALFLASRHPEIKGLITYSPAVRIFRKEAALMAGPWGLQIARWVIGKEHNDWTFKKPEQHKYWTNHQRLEAPIQFATFQKYTMTPETFSKVKCPLFVGYYYENEENQDKTVSVAAMKGMLAQVSTPQYQKVERSFPKSHHHVIASDLTSDDWQTVESESIKFMKEVLNMSEKQ